jgi:hypothetical protein
VANPARFRLYLDESGDPVYNLLDQPAHQFLALLGVWFRENDDYVVFADAMDAFKREMFGPRPDNPVIFHRSDIINRRGPFGLLREPENERNFNEGLIQLISNARFKMTCVLLDKQIHFAKYADPFHPYHYCLAAMLDRYSGWLNFKNARGDVMAESRGKEEDIQLMQAYQRVRESGTLIFDRIHHQRALTSKEIKIRKKSENIAGLQLADLLAYPFKQSCLLEKGLIPDPGEVFGKRIYLAAHSKLNCQEFSGQISGYGKVWL